MAGTGPVGARGAGFLCLLSALVSGDMATAQTEAPLEILAVRVREQGHACDKPIKAERDKEASEPHRAVWRLQCSNASYRIVLHPDMGAEIDVLKR